MWGKKIFV